MECVLMPESLEVAAAAAIATPSSFLVHRDSLTAPRL